MNKTATLEFSFPISPSIYRIAYFFDNDHELVQNIDFYANFSIIPNKTLHFKLSSLNESLVFEKTYPLEKSSTVDELIKISLLLGNKLLEEILETSVDFYGIDDEDFVYFIDNNFPNDSILAFALYPNLFKTKFVFNFFNVLQSDEQLEILCSENPSPLEVSRAFFPLLKKNSAKSISSMFSYKKGIEDVYTDVSFCFQILELFKNEDKFSSFFNKTTNLYNKEFNNCNFISFQGSHWLHDSYHSFIESIMPFLPDKKNTVEDFLINSLDSLFEEIISNYEDADMGDDINDGRMNVFFLLDYYKDDIVRNLSAINSFVANADAKHKNYQEMIKLHDRFFSRLKAKDIITFHDDLAAHFIDLSTTLNGEINFGSKEKLENTSFYEYSDETLSFFNEEINGFSFKLAESNQDLIFLGNIMQHCVGGYSDLLEENKNHFILGLFEGNRPLLCIEITDKTIIQAKKNKNHRLNRRLEKDREMIRALREYIIDRNLTIKTGDLVSVRV